jgi:hypothetical protein
MPLFPKPVVPVIVACLALALLPFVLGQGQDFNTQQRVVLLPFPYNAGTESSFPTHFVVAVGGDIIFQVSNTVSASGLAVWSPITREPEALESSVGPLTIVTNTPGYHASRSNNVMGTLRQLQYIFSFIVSRRRKNAQARRVFSALSAS